MLGKLPSIKKYFFVSLLGLVGSMPAYADVNVTGNFYSLKSASFNQNGYISNLYTGSTYDYNPTYNFGNYNLNIRNQNKIGPGYLGNQDVIIKAKNINFETNSLLKMGNESPFGGDSNLTLIGNISMAKGSMLQGQRGHITIQGSISGNGKIQMDSGYKLSVTNATNITLDNLSLSGASTLSASNSITINNSFSGSGGNITLNASSGNISINNSFSGSGGNITLNASSGNISMGNLSASTNVVLNANNLDIKNTLSLYESTTLNALGIKGSINVGTFSTWNSGWLSLASATLDTHANVTVGTINLANYGGGRVAKIDTHGYGDITLKGDLKVNGGVGSVGLAGSVAKFWLNGKNITLQKDVVLGYYTQLSVSGIGDFNAQKINVGNGSTTGNTTLDFAGIKGHTDIKTLELSTASVYGGNFHIGTLIAHKGASRSVFYNNIGTSSIDTLNLVDNGTSKADNTILEFRGGGSSLNITNVNLASWGELDASKIGALTIDNLVSSYATIKAKKITLNNAKFTNSETWLFADEVDSKGSISLDNNAKLYLKSGKTLTTDTLNMHNGSNLYASTTNGGGMSGLTTIHHIIFDNSQIYANNLITDDITIKNNASVFLNKGNYTNNGDLNINDGSYLKINGGDFINDGKINITMGPSPKNNATKLIDVLNGSFTFDMTLSDTGIKDPITNKNIIAPKAEMNVVLNLSGLISGTTYNLLSTANGIEFKDGSVIYKSSDKDYAKYKEALNQRIFFKTLDNSSVAVNYSISDNNKDIYFTYDTGKHYVNASPFIKPGTWVLGVGSGAAAFGSIGGAPGASGLAKDYTLTLQKQPWHNPVTNKDENTIYYIQNLTYNNYGNPDAKFTINAQGSDFALGKTQDIGGYSGTINIGPHTMKSHMIINADNIYLGGNINLGDGALISGHLILNGTGEILGDDPSSVINVKNHSSLKASGTSFDYRGTIKLSGNKTTTDEVGLDLSKISGPISIAKLEATAARPNAQDPNAGIKMKDFSIKDMIVYNGNGGSVNNFYSQFTTNIGTSNIGHLVLNAGSSGADQSGLKFSGGGDSLTIDTLDVGSWSFLVADKITDTYINKAINLPYSKEINVFDGGVHGVNFNNLTLNPGAVMNYGGSSILKINGDFTNRYGLININPDKDIIQTINVAGSAAFYFNSDGTNANGNATPLIKISDISGLKIGKEYTLLHADKGITYIYTTSEGKVLKSSDSKDIANLLYGEMADRIALFSNTGKDDFDVTKTVNDRKISFKIESTNNDNPYDPNDVRYWFYKRGGAKWIDDINATGDGVMDWFQKLMMEKHNAFWTKNLTFNNDLKYFLRIGKQLESTMGQLSSVNRKNNSTDSVRIATDVSKTSRLVKLSSTVSLAPRFAQVIRELQKEKFADSSRNIANIYKFANRNIYKNNIWATAIGSASFVEGGNSTLYGVNVGYDRFIRNIIVGGYIAYAYGNYSGDIIRNHSENFNGGFYSRIYAGNNEFDLSASETIGLNKEQIYSEDIVLQQLNQKYSYNTYTSNVNFNYGYVFGINDKSVVIKPQIGVSYYYISATKISGKADNPVNRDIEVEADPDKKENIAINLAIETRQYFHNASYWYFIAGVSRDVYLESKGDKEIRFVGDNTSSYKKGDELNTYASLTAGGELAMFNRFFVNLGLGAKAGITYKDINITGNVGMRFVF